MAVIIAWVLFRAESVDGASRLLQVMFGLSGFTLPDSLPFTGFSLIAISGAAALMPSIQEMFGPLFPSIDPEPRYRGRLGSALAWRPSYGWGATIALLGSWSIILMMVRLTPVEFVYFQF